MKTKKLMQGIEDGAHHAVDYLTPYVEQALKDGGEIADQAYARLRPALTDARIRGARLAADTLDRVQPVLDEALDRVSPAVDATVKRVKPAVDDVLLRIPPSVDHARERLQDDFLPHLAGLLRSLASQPLAKELKVAVASAALAKELEKAAGPRRKSGWRTFGKLALAAAVLGGVAVAVRKLLAEPATGWETHTPKTAYVADPVADDPGAADEEALIQQETQLQQEATAQEAGIEEELEKLADAAEGGDASPLAGSPYGEGSYVGAEPPAGFTIKGNDRSMKYHLPGSSAYERTVPAVWFASEEAALAAGFSRPQR